MFDKFGNPLKIDTSCEVLAHGDVPAFIGDVLSINVNERYVTIGYDNDEEGAIAWDCDPDFVVIE